MFVRGVRFFLRVVSGILPAVFFLRCVHTFFDDFDLSKRDKQVKPSGH